MFNCISLTFGPRLIPHYVCLNALILHYANLQFDMYYKACSVVSDIGILRMINDYPDFINSETYYYDTDVCNAYNYYRIGNQDIASLISCIFILLNRGIKQKEEQTLSVIGGCKKLLICNIWTVLLFCDRSS